MNNEIQFILYQLPDEEGKVQVVVKGIDVPPFTLTLQDANTGISNPAVAIA